MPIRYTYVWNETNSSYTFDPNVFFWSTGHTISSYIYSFLPGSFCLTVFQVLCLESIAYLSWVSFDNCFPLDHVFIAYTISCTYFVKALHTYILSKPKSIASQLFALLPAWQLFVRNEYISFWSHTYFNFHQWYKCDIREVLL